MPIALRLILYGKWKCNRYSILGNRIDYILYKHLSLLHHRRHLPSSYSFSKKEAFDIADPSTMQDACHI